MKTSKPTTILFCTMLTMVVSACSSGQVKNQAASRPVTLPNEPTSVFQKSTSSLTQIPGEIATKLPTKSPTRTDIPTEIPSVDFDLSDVNKISPEDIFEEVAYFGLGGDQTGCDEAYNGPIMCDIPAQVDYLMPVELRSVGWEMKETIQVSISYPDGRIENRSFKMDDYPASFIFKPTFSDPLGTYRFIFTGKSGVTKTSILYIKPVGPQLLPIDDTHILLYGFSPRESVKLFCYTQHVFTGWQSIQVDQNGDQVVKADLNRCRFAAINQSGQEVHLLGVKDTEDELHWGHPIIRVNCGGLYSRLFVHGLASVAFTDGSNMRLRANPGFSQEVLSKVPEGTRLDIMDGPKCVNNSIWWKVLVFSGSGPSFGWMTEEQNGVYLLQPEK